MKSAKRVWEDALDLAERTKATAERIEGKWRKMKIRAKIEKVTGGAKRGEYWRIGIYGKVRAKDRWELVDTISGFETEDEAGRALADMVKMTTKADDGGQKD